MRCMEYGGMHGWGRLGGWGGNTRFIPGLWRMLSGGTLLLSLGVEPLK